MRQRTHLLIYIFSLFCSSVSVTAVTINQLVTKEASLQYYPSTDTHTYYYAPSINAMTVVQSVASVFTRLVQTMRNTGFVTIGSDIYNEPPPQVSHLLLKNMRMNLLNFES